MYILLVGSFTAAYFRHLRLFAAVADLNFPFQHKNLNFAGNALHFMHFTYIFLISIQFNLLFFSSTQTHNIFKLEFVIRFALTFTANCRFRNYCILFFFFKKNKRVCRFLFYYFCLVVLKCCFYCKRVLYGYSLNKNFYLLFFFCL